MHSLASLWLELDTPWSHILFPPAQERFIFCCLSFCVIFMLTMNAGFNDILRTHIFNIYYYTQHQGPIWNRAIIPPIQEECTVIMIKWLHGIVTNSVAQEPEGSSPYSQQLTTGPYPEPVESNPHIPANLPKIHSAPIVPPTPWSSEWSLSFGISHQNLVHFSLLSHARHMPCPPHSHWLDAWHDVHNNYNNNRAISFWYIDVWENMKTNG
jgi:hypothetical protein